MRRLLAALRLVLLVLLGLLVLSFASSCTATVGVHEVYMSIDSDGTRRRTQFFTDTQVIACIIDLDAGRGDATLEAVIRQVARFDPAKGGLTPSDRVVGALDQPIGKGKQNVVLGLAKKDPVTGEEKAELPFPVGQYKCEIRIDGKLEDTANFSIEFAPCPTAAILPKSKCQDFYRARQQCPAFGASSREPGTCTCDDNGVWSC